MSLQSTLTKTEQDQISPRKLDDALLFTRTQTARLLNVSIATLQRLEKKGVLTPIKLNRSTPSAMTHYRAKQVYELAAGGRP